MVQFNRFILNIALSLVSVNAITHLLNNLPVGSLPVSLDDLPFGSLPVPLDGLPLGDLSLPSSDQGNSEGCLGFLGGVGSMLGVDTLLGCKSSEQPEHRRHGHHGHHGHHHHHPGNKAEEEHMKENIDITFHENISEDESHK